MRRLPEWTFRGVCWLTGVNSEGLDEAARSLPEDILR